MRPERKQNPWAERKQASWRSRLAWRRMEQDHPSLAWQNGDWGRVGKGSGDESWWISGVVGGAWWQGAAWWRAARVSTRQGRGGVRDVRCLLKSLSEGVTCQVKSGMRQ